MASENRLSEQQTNIKFVLEVKKRPCLYNPDLLAYSRKDITDKAWEEVGKIMKLTGAASKEKWRNMRIVFMRHMKSMSPYSGTGRRKRRYYLSEALQFLVPYIKLPPSLDTTDKVQDTGKLTFPDMYRRNEDEDEDDDIPESWKEPLIKLETDDDQSNDTNQDSDGNSSRKRPARGSKRYNTLSETDRFDQPAPFLVTGNDPVRAFLSSLVPELNELNSNQFKSFKRRVLQLIDDITDESVKPQYSLLQHTLEKCDNKI